MKRAVEASFNAPGNNPYPDGSSSTGVDLGGLRSGGASSPSSGNPGSILLLNLNDLTNPNPGPNIFDPPEEEELLELTVLRAEQAPAVAMPDVTVAPISLRRADAPPLERTVIELEPRMRVECVIKCSLSNGGIRRLTRRRHPPPKDTAETKSAAEMNNRRDSAPVRRRDSYLTPEERRPRP